NHVGYTTSWLRRTTRPSAVIGHSPFNKFRRINIREEFGNLLESLVSGNRSVREMKKLLASRHGNIKEAALILDRPAITSLIRNQRSTAKTFPGCRARPLHGHWGFALHGLRRFLQIAGKTAGWNRTRSARADFPLQP